MHIYLPITRLLSLHVAAIQGLYAATQHLPRHPRRGDAVHHRHRRLGGGRASRRRPALLRALLRRWPNTPKVELIATDGFLLPNAVLKREGLMERKGFPESYDLPALLAFLSDIKAAKKEVTAPVYSHLSYDIVPGETVKIERPDILIVEGLNVLQTSRLPRDGRAVPFVSDFFDFSIYIDADERVIRDWYLERFLRLRETAFRDPQSYFHRYASITTEEALTFAEGLWSRINLANLRENILPTRPRAHLILRKGEDHRIEQVALRRI